ncbi:hypothetical protein [Halopseudomonas laoshanensis]|uniref:hypothetical protein n=1 Tax=Halopseudomonas laoshanensis TaxID=2268758 RepID=UPI00373533F7
MKRLSARDLVVKDSMPNSESAKELTLERVRRFKEADRKLKEVCARLGIEKPRMVS